MVLKVYDFIHCRIFFKSEFYSTIQKGDSYQFEIDMNALIDCGLTLSVNVSQDSHGDTQMSQTVHPWSSIPSSFTGIAFKVFQGSGFREAACLEFKASPAKVMQGQNVYGSDCLQTCVTYMMENIKRAFPKLSKLLDFKQTYVIRLDTTYSLQLESRDQLEAAINSLSQVSNRSLRQSKDNQDTTVYFNRSKNNPDSGRATSLCIYSKSDEVLHQIEDLKKRSRKEKTSIYDRVIKELESDELQNFASNRLRFEARLKSRWFQNKDIPQNLFELLDYVRTFEHQSGESFCLWSWRQAMKDLLEAIQGQTISVVHDHHVKSLLHKHFDSERRAPNGTPYTSTSKALRLFALYDRLKHNTYKRVKDTMSKSAFYRGINDLMSIGFSKSELQSLSISEHVPMAQVLTFDFDNQVPANYVKPFIGHLDTPEKLLAYLTDEDEKPLAVNLVHQVRDALDSHGLHGVSTSGLISGNPVRLASKEAVSLVILGGQAKLVFHEPDTSNEICSSRCTKDPFDSHVSAYIAHRRFSKTTDLSVTGSYASVRSGLTH
ncbi:replication protein [Vibrio campbellii]|nr:replication protein [Vibrio campbellii]UTZ38253.1 replication protein [Vibrio campbellii]